MSRGSCWRPEVGLLRCYWRLRHQRMLRLISEDTFNLQWSSIQVSEVHLRLNMRRLQVGVG